MSKRFSYDPIGDSMIISNRKDNERTRKNFMFGNLVFSLTNKGKITGLEIKDFSSFLEDYDLNSSILSTLEEVKIDFLVQRDILVVKLIIKTKKIVKSLPVTRLPLQTISF